MPPTVLETGLRGGNRQSSSLWCLRDASKPLWRNSPGSHCSRDTEALEWLASYCFIPAGHLAVGWAAAGPDYPECQLACSRDAHCPLPLCPEPLQPWSGCFYPNYSQASPLPSGTHSQGHASAAAQQSSAGRVPSFPRHPETRPVSRDCWEGQNVPTAKRSRQPGLLSTVLVTQEPAHSAGASSPRASALSLQPHTLLKYP